MIKNKELLEIIERKKNEVSCENCIFCHLGAYYSGKWYCKNPSISVGDVIDIDKCFQRKQAKHGKAE